MLLLQMMVLDVLDCKAWGYKVNMAELFKQYKQYDLNLVDQKRAQRRRWRESRLRGLVVPWTKVSV